MEQSLQDTLFKAVVGVLVKYDVDFEGNSVEQLIRSWCLQ